MSRDALPRPDASHLLSLTGIHQLILELWNPVIRASFSFRKMCGPAYRKGPQERINNSLLRRFKAYGTAKDAWTILPEQLPAIFLTCHSEKIARCFKKCEFHKHPSGVCLRHHTRAERMELRSFGGAAQLLVCER